MASMGRRCRPQARGLLLFDRSPTVADAKGWIAEQFFISRADLTSVDRRGPPPTLGHEPLAPWSPTPSRPL